MAMARVGDVNLYCEEWGSGEPLLLIMGMGANTTDWEPQIQALCKEHRLIAFDNRGSGRSDRPDEPVTMERLADDAVALLDCFGVERSHIFGMSMGGYDCPRVGSPPPSTPAYPHPRSDHVRRPERRASPDEADHEMDRHTRPPPQGSSRGWASPSCTARSSSMT